MNKRLIVILCLVSSWSVQSWAAAPSEGCFTLEKPRTFLGPIAADDQFLTGDNRDGGKLAAPGVHWASTTHTHSVGQNALIERLSDPFSIKDPKTQKVTVKLAEKDPKQPSLERFESRTIGMNPVFFVHIEWIEEWFFDRLTPKKMLISYQKRSGTSHMRHFCGNILIEELGPSMARLSMYEELDADYRKAADVLSSVQGTAKNVLLVNRESAKPESKP